MTSGPVSGAGSLAQDLLADAPHFVLGHVAEARARDGLHRREDPAHQVRTAGADVGELVRLEDLLDAAAGHLVAGGRLAVAGHDHAVTEAHRENGGAVHGLDLGKGRRRPARNQVRRLAAQQVDEARVRIVAEQRTPALVAHGHIPAARAMLRSRSAAVGDSVSSWRTCASVPRSGSSMKIFLSGPSFRSKITESQLAETISSA